MAELTVHFFMIEMYGWQISMAPNVKQQLCLTVMLLLFPLQEVASANWHYV